MDGEKVIRIDDINARSVVRDLLRNIWIAVLAAAGAWMLTAACITLFYQPEYTSTAVLSVNVKGNSDTYSSLNDAKSMAQVFAEIFEGDVLKEKVALALEEKKLEDDISTEVVPETNLLRVNVVSSTPERAYQILVAVLDNYPSIADYLFENAIIDVVEKPGISQEPSNSLETGKYKIGASVIAALVVMFIIMAFSALRDTVQTRQGAKHKLDGSLFGIVYHEEKKRSDSSKKKKTAALITNQLVGYRFMEDNKTLAAKLNYYMKKRNQKVVLVCSAGENEGKSTIAANLSLSLAEKGNKVLLVDCDFRKPAIRKIFDLEEKKMDFGAYLMDSQEGDLKKVLIRKHGIFIAANQKNYGTVQKLIASDKMKEMLEEQKKVMDYIIIDSPPMLAAADTEALAQLCDVSLLVVRQDWTLVQDINDCIDILKQSSAEFIGYILNDIPYERLSNKKKGIDESKNKRKYTEFSERK